MEITCPNCNKQMNFFTQTQIQLGKTGWILGDLPNLVAGALEVNIYMCPNCHKLELFAVEENKFQDSLPKKTCPVCGTIHDFDYPRCPNCKNQY